MRLIAKADPDSIQTDWTEYREKEKQLWKDVKAILLNDGWQNLDPSLDVG